MVVTALGNLMVLILPIEMRKKRLHPLLEFLATWVSSTAMTSGRPSFHYSRCVLYLYKFADHRNKFDVLKRSRYNMGDFHHLRSKTSPPPVEPLSNSRGSRFATQLMKNTHIISTKRSRKIALQSLCSKW